MDVACRIIDYFTLRHFDNRLHQPVYIHLLLTIKQPATS